MIKLTIIENDEYANYVLKDTDGNTYDVNINFMNMDKPKVGTIIYIPKSVIEEKVSLNYDKIDLKELTDENEIIVLQNGDQKLFLERYYG